MGSEMCIRDSVAADNALNCAVLDAMNPCAAMLKFRLPFRHGSSRLPSGQLRYQCWSSAASTETRLICTRPYAYVMYNHTEHEEIMYHHNTTRPYPLIGVYANEHVSMLLHRLGKPLYYDAYRESEVISKLLAKTTHSQIHVYSLIDEISFSIRT